MQKGQIMHKGRQKEEGRRKGERERGNWEGRDLMREAGRQ